eukprot:TRINITY_DN9709_c0_g1_i1.p1 TRINITY_DN9709_c0_g1~~TRINITY_DN9709_c0_g1_i1.p1  ORF type:complete len:140 (+),score=22.80 TRINITY_DN9709_c0_g1_i1:138-557(+)
MNIDEGTRVVNVECAACHKKHSKTLQEITEANNILLCECGKKTKLHIQKKSRDSAIVAPPSRALSQADDSTVNSLPSPTNLGRSSEAGGTEDAAAKKPAIKPLTKKASCCVLCCACCPACWTVCLLLFGFNSKETEAKN